MTDKRLAELIRLMTNASDPRAAWELHEYAVGKGPWAKLLVSPFLIALRSLDTRDAAAMGLEAIGAHAVDAVPELIRAMQYEPDDYCINPFVCALGAIGPAAKEAVPALMVALEHAHEQWDWTVCRDVAEALGKIGGKEAVPLISKLLDPEDPHLKKATQAASCPESMSDLVRAREGLKEAAEEALARLT